MVQAIPGVKKIAVEVVEIVESVMFLQKLQLKNSV